MSAPRERGPMKVPVRAAKHKQTHATSMFVALGEVVLYGKRKHARNNGCLYSLDWTTGLDYWTDL